MSTRVVEVVLLEDEHVSQVITMPDGVDVTDQCQISEDHDDDVHGAFVTLPDDSVTYWVMAEFYGGHRMISVAPAEEEET